MKKFWGSRYGFAVILILTSAICTVLFAGLISLFKGNFILGCKLVFLCFFAFPVVSVSLLVLTNIPEEWTPGFGAGLYYGTIFVSAITREVGWDLPELDRILHGVIDRKSVV